MTLTLNEPSKPHLKRWTKQEYYDLVDRGAFRGQRVFLYRGELIEMPPMGALHAIGISNLDDWFHDTFRPEYRIRIQMPFETPGQTVPEPDGAIVTREQMIRRPASNHALLLVEVSDSSPELDQEKASDYAATQSAEYWIVNMRHRCVEVYLEPITDSTAPLGHRYALHRIYREDESIAPLALPDASVTVARLVSAT